MTPEQVKQVAIMVVDQGYSVTLGPIDPLNPRIGIRCIIEGPFGKVSGDSSELSRIGRAYTDYTTEAYFQALLQLTRHVNGLESNVQKNLSLLEKVFSLSESTLAGVWEAIGAELIRRRTKRFEEETTAAVQSAIKEAFPR